MSDATENLLLEHMKAFRSELKEMRLAMHDEFKDLKHRVTQLELHGVGARRDTVGAQEDVYRQQTTIDRINATSVSTGLRGACN